MAVSLDVAQGNRIGSLRSLSADFTSKFSKYMHFSGKECDAIQNMSSCRRLTRPITPWVVVTGSILCAAVYMSAILKTKGIAGFDPSDPAEMKARRVAARGSLTSIASALSLGVLSTALDVTSDIELMTSQILISMTLSNVIGFVLDNAFGSDVGIEHMKTVGAHKSMQHGLSQLTNSNFARYMVTVLIDVFISSIFIDKLKSLVSEQTSSNPSGLSRDSPVFGYFNCGVMGTLVPTIMTTMIGVLTFFAYTNSTRFDWAIRNSRFPRTVHEWAAHPHIVNCRLPSVVRMRDKVLLPIRASDPKSTADESWQMYFGSSRANVAGSAAFVTDADERPKVIALFSTMNDRDDCVGSTNLIMGASVAAALYFSSSIDGVSDGVKVAQVLGMFLLLFAIYKRGVLEKTPLPSTETLSTQSWKGVAILLSIAATCTTGVFMKHSKRLGENEHITGWRRKVLWLLCTSLLATLVVSSQASAGSLRVGLVVALCLVVVYGVMASKFSATKGPSLIAQCIAERRGGSDASSTLATES